MDKGWECFDCGATVPLMQAVIMSDWAEANKLPKLEKPRCTQCKSENVRKYF